MLEVPWTNKYIITQTKKLEKVTVSIRLFQGDSSKVIKVTPNLAGGNIMDPTWKCVMAVTDDSGRAFIKKQMNKDSREQSFVSFLQPDETIKLIPGRYTLAFQITNEDLGYRQEMHDTLKVKPQVIWDEDNFGTTSSMPTISEDSSCIPE